MQVQKTYRLWNLDLYNIKILLDLYAYKDPRLYATRL